MFQVSGPDVSKLNKQQEYIRSIPGVQTKISCSQNVRDKFEKNQQNYTSRLATFVSVTKSDGTSKTNAQVRVMGHQLLHCLSKKNRNFHCSHCELNFWEKNKPVNNCQDIRKDPKDILEILPLPRHSKVLFAIGTRGVLVKGSEIFVLMYPERSREPQMPSICKPKHRLQTNLTQIGIMLQ